MVPTCILGCQYLPGIEYFAHWAHHGTIAIEAHEHYQKRSWRNRTTIQSGDAPLMLTIPLLQGKHQQMPIRDVEIAYHAPWVNIHINSLQSTYGKTAFANEVLPGINQILMAGYHTLWTLNLALLDHVISLMHAPYTYVLTDSFEHTLSNNITDQRNGIASGIPSASLIQLPTYPQVHRLDRPFQANLSILDVLCHLGPLSTDYITKYAAKLYPGT